MCFCDWRIGRLIRAESTAFNLVGLTDVDFPANKQRVGLTIGLAHSSTSQGVDLTISFDGIVHCMLWRNFLVYHITLATHGDLPTRPFNLLATGATLPGSVIEYFAPESVLTAGIEEWERTYGQWAN